MRCSIAVSLVALLFLSGCGDEATENADASSAPTFEPATAIIETDEGPVLVNVEVADTEEERARGLMHRESLDEDAGMLFIFFEPTSSGFWMKNTKIPLSIAFFDMDGRILRILDMEPCKKEPCRIYSPGVEYLGALEVNQGAFQDWGVSVGDRIDVNV